MDENRICLPSSFRSAVDKEVITNVVNMSQTPQVVRKQLKRSGFFKVVGDVSPLCDDAPSSVNPGEVPSPRSMVASPSTFSLVSLRI